MVDEAPANIAQFMAAATRTRVPLAEYAANKLAGLKYCWKCHRWVTKRKYASHPLTKLCRDCDGAKSVARRERRRRRADRDEARALMAEHAARLAAQPVELVEARPHLTPLPLGVRTGEVLHFSPVRPISPRGPRPRSLRPGESGCIFGSRFGGELEVCVWS
jgi:hypothetical protein